MVSAQPRNQREPMEALERGEPTEAFPRPLSLLPLLRGDVGDAASPMPSSSKARGCWHLSVLLSRELVS